MRTKAAMIRQAGQPWEVTTRELDDPGPREVLIKFFASGLCHSDERVRAERTEARRPMVGGHEGAGVVEAFGEDVCDLGAEMLTGLLASGRSSSTRTTAPRLAAFARSAPSRSER
jgi:Zn-dependent alcohol dehydrogenase